MDTTTQSDGILTNAESRALTSRRVLTDIDLRKCQAWGAASILVLEHFVTAICAHGH